MLIEYINKAMSKTVYEKLEDGTYLGKIPQCPGVIAFGETLYECQEEVRSVLEGWLIVKLRHGDKLPGLEICGTLFKVFNFFVSYPHSFSM